MPRRDEIDPALVKHFAWSFVPPDKTAEVSSETLRAARAAEQAETVAETPADADAPEAEVAQQDERALAEMHARSRAACEPLAVGIADAWATVDAEKRLAAVKRLLSRANRLGVEIVGMQEWPVEAVRMLRLLVEVGPRLSRGQRERGASVAGLMPLDHPETADLLSRPRARATRRSPTGSSPTTSGCPTWATTRRSSRGWPTSSTTGRRTRPARSRSSSSRASRGVGPPWRRCGARFAFRASRSGRARSMRWPRRSPARSRPRTSCRCCAIS